jgi:hypothetical protein
MPAQRPVSGMAMSPLAEESRSIITVASLTDVVNLGAPEVDDLLVRAMDQNDVDHLSMFLALQDGGLPQRIESLTTGLLRRAFECDAAECTMLLLNHVEQLRQHKQAEHVRARTQEEEDALFLHKDGLIKTNKAGKLQLREEFIVERERHCGAAPTSRQLLALAAEAMQRAPPAQRCARALLLQAHRLRKEVPEVGRPLPAVDGSPLPDANGMPSIEWPRLPTDLPRGFFSSGEGVGGVDLSLGAEAVPVQWINEVDHATPPPIAFMRRAIDVDVRPDWLKCPVKQCDTTLRAVDGTYNNLARPGDRCADATFPATKPSGHCECNWACSVSCACICQCSRRSLQRGASFRLQVRCARPRRVRADRRIVVAALTVPACVLPPPGLS